MRTVFLDYDARPQPKTKRWCSKCQRDIKPTSAARVIRLRVDDMHILHPDDAGDQGEMALLGMDCAQLVGLEWSRPEQCK